jgi:hypothetical protein
VPLQLLSIVPPIDADVVNIRTGRDVTVHGFRSAFRDWAGDEGEVPRELAEASLAMWSRTRPSALIAARRPLSGCSSPLGVILPSSLGNVCGQGQCVQDTTGQIYCSAQPGGFAVVEMGQFRCTGGCEIPRPEYCQNPR